MNKLCAREKSRKKKMCTNHTDAHTHILIIFFAFSVVELVVYSVCRFVSCVQPISKEIAFEFAHKNNFYLTAFNRCVTQRKKTDRLSHA